MVRENVHLSRHRLERAKEELASSQLLFNNKRLAQSINRSYYAMFHATRSLLALESFDSKKHSGVIAFFNKNFVKTGKIEKEYSKILMEARDCRMDSDYDDFFVVSKEEAASQIEDADKFIKRIESFIKENY